MQKIKFSTPGAMLERSSDGKLVRKSCRCVVELPYSKENLQQAQRQAFPGTVQVLAAEETSQPDGALPATAQQCICLEDRATGQKFKLYIENGQLMKEAL